MKEKNLDELKLELEELNEKIEDKRLEKIQGRKKTIFWQHTKFRKNFIWLHYR